MISTACLATFLSAALAAESPVFPPAVESAHRELWQRFFHPRAAVLLDHAGMDGTVILPTAEECRTAKPNGLAWGCSTEDGPMFCGVYLEALVHRAQLSGSEADRRKARRVADGLMKLATLGQTRGFIARGLSDDGTAWHPIGSNDQTFPWIYGLWRYLQSDLPSAEQRSAIRRQLVVVIETLEQHGWKVPCDRPPFDYRGSFARFDWESAPRLLFLARVAADLTGDGRWQNTYRQLLDERNPKHADGQPDRRALCRRGMVHHDPKQGPRHTWTAGAGVIALRGLWELERDEALRAVYAEGLHASVELAAESLPLARQFDNDDQRTFLLDWRKLNTIWRPQASVAESHKLAEEQLAMLDRLSPRREYECQYVREPLYAAWTVTLSHDPAQLRRYAPAVLAAIEHYRYDRLYLSQFFPAENAYYRLALAKALPPQK